MAADPNAVEQAVSRTLRDNLEKIQRTADELHQAVNDMVAACASSRASNALPSMIRAQTSAASLAATLEVLSRFVTGALQPAMRMPFEPDTLRVPSMGAPPAGAFEQPPSPPPHPREEISWAAPAPAPVVPAPKVPEIPPAVQAPAAPGNSPAIEMPNVVEPAPALEPVFLNDPEPVTLHDQVPDFELELPIETHPAVEAQAAVPPVEAAPVFNLDLLPPEEQELHRRAFRVAKVCMQDIRMLRPEDVRVGRENKDLCFRLRDDIEKAHKEYDRRFQAIQSHPVDYFYDWMVEILGGGDPKALGEYPYPSPVLRR
ncbi:MAG: hypothetical protein WCA19_28180 [Candidatus Acidiferrales bacterium]